MKHRVILIVEDDTDIRETLTALLDGEGYPVLAAENGRKALDLLNAKGPRPSLVLLDLMMPVMDGKSFLAEMAKSPRLAGLPVVILSAAVDDSVRNVVASLRKPVDVETILSYAEQYAA